MVILNVLLLGTQNGGGKQSHQSVFSYLHAGLNVRVLVHDGQDGLHTAVFYQVWLIPHQDQWYPATTSYMILYGAAG
jgi:hypothetical protein